MGATPARDRELNLAMARRSSASRNSIGSTMGSYQRPQREPSDSIESVYLPVEYEPDDQIIPDYLEPIGSTGFFITPEEPADPTDCERYPNSPFCGGTGVDIDSLIELSPVYIEPSISANDCEICIRMDSSLFWISLPVNYICYRSKDPSCNPLPEPDPPPGPTPPPGLPPGGWTATGGSYPPGSNCRMITEHKQMILFSDEQGNGYCAYEETWQLMGTTAGSALGFYTTKIAEGTVEIQWAGIRAANGEPELLGNTMIVTSQCGGYIYRERPVDATCKHNGTTTVSPPPFPPSDQRTCCMSCCSNDSANQEQLDLLRLIAKRLGTKSYPVSTPKWLVTNLEEATVKHESLTDFQFWLVRQLDALIGEFPIRVQIQDADPTEAGQQPKSVNLPNLAEAVAEIYGLAAKTSVDSDVHTSFLMRLAAEVMAAKNAALIAQDYASANASYLGYQGNQVERAVTYAFDPTELDSLETILKESRKYIVGWQNDDKENVAAYLQKLMFSAGLIKTIFFRKGKDLERILKEVSQFMPDPESEESAGWKEFIQLINNPESLENKETELKPEIRPIDKKQTGGN